jgi:hypothetical protein
MSLIPHAGDTIEMGELWWVMLLEAGNPTQARMSERYYLSEEGPEGCRRILSDVQKSSDTIPMLAVNLEQIDGILHRFDVLSGAGEIIDIGESRDEAWLVWVDQGEEGVTEQWTWTRDPHEAERAAMQRKTGASPLLRASLSTLRQARSTLRRVTAGWWQPIWLDLRDPPRNLSSALLLERKIESSHEEG